ncbi:hypothetical protein F4677DRAFT_441980 [Hypoxylon crocopeplum]|nr:hypothetical protein F4677DRAFT_441980 [Hypoxylon crocopeplum]
MGSEPPRRESPYFLATFSLLLISFYLWAFSLLFRVLAGTTTRWKYLTAAVQIMSMGCIITGLIHCASPSQYDVTVSFVSAPVSLAGTLFYLLIEYLVSAIRLPN